MDDKEIQILEKIIDLEGDCLSAGLCIQCPFKHDCLPEFLKTKKYRPSPPERLNLALDKIANTILLDDL